MDARPHVGRREVHPRLRLRAQRTSSGSYYDRYWTAEGYNPRREGATPELRALFARYVRGQDDCLDLGCGEGTSGAYLRANARSYVGVDISAKAVAVARERGLDARRIEDAGCLPFDDCSFDVVVCVEVLEHLFEPHRAAAEAARVLRPGGTLVATVPNAAHWRDRVDMFFGVWQPGGDDLGRTQPWRSPHIRFFRPATLESMLSSSGFREVQVDGWSGPLLERVPVLRRFNRTAGSFARSLCSAWPSLFATQIVAIARR